MTKCPHAIEYGPRTHCLLGGFAFRPSGGLCGRCREHWVGDAAPSVPTPPLAEIIAKVSETVPVGRRQQADPLDSVVIIAKPPLGVRRLTRPRKLIRKPHECDHSGRRIVKGQTCASSVYECDIHGTATCEKCTECQDFIPIELPRLADVVLRPITGRIVAGMTTAPRPVSTVAASLASLRGAGFGDVALFAEPGSEVPDGIQWTKFDPAATQLGAWGNFVRMVTSLAGGLDDGDYLAAFQDDVAVAAGLAGHLRSGVPGGVLSLYVSAVAARSVQGDGWILRGPADIPAMTYGALAYLIPAAIAKRFAGRPPVSRNGRRVDVVFGDWCRKSRIPFWQHKPSFVEHTGSLSTLRPGISMGPARTAGRVVTAVRDGGLETNGVLP